MAFARKNARRRLFTMSRLIDDIKQQKWAIISVIAYLLIMKVFFHNLCPIVLITGYPCAACGMTRAALALLRLDFQEALYYHAFIFPLAVMAIYLFIKRYLKKERIGKGVVYIFIIMVVLSLIYYIYRMYRYFPGEPPMSFYYQNILGNSLG